MKTTTRSMHNKKAQNRCRRERPSLLVLYFCIHTLLLYYYLWLLVAVAIVIIVKVYTALSVIVAVALFIFLFGFLLCFFCMCMWQTSRYNISKKRAANSDRYTTHTMKCGEKHQHDHTDEKFYETSLQSNSAE